MELADKKFWESKPESISIGGVIATGRRMAELRKEIALKSVDYILNSMEREDV